MRYVGGIDELGAPIEVKDPLAPRLKILSDGADTPEAKVAALLSVREVFSEELASALAAPVSTAYAALVKTGARAAAKDVLK
jgi:fructuronate reductase